VNVRSPPEYFGVEVVYDSVMSGPVQVSVAAGDGDDVFLLIGGGDEGRRGRCGIGGLGAHGERREAAAAISFAEVDEKNEPSIKSEKCMATRKEEDALGNDVQSMYCKHCK
jgi:hypothetical protein